MPPSSPECRAHAITARFTAVAVALALFAPGRAAQAQSDGPLCVDPRVVVDAVLSDDWSAAVRRLCAMLSTWTDADPSARMRVTPSGRDVILEVGTGDGRVALRRVHSPEDLELAVEALMTVPSVRNEAPVPNVTFTHSSPVLSGGGSPPAQLTTVPAASPSPTTSTAGTDPVADAPSATVPHLPVEIGGAVVARLSRPPTYLSAGVDLYAGIRPGAWLLALRVRWDALQYLAVNAPSQFEMDTVGAGFMLARRALTAQSVALDVGFGALLLVETQSINDGKDGKTKDSDVDVRLSLEPRLLFGRGPLRWALSLEGELSPIRLRRDLAVGPGLPTLPSWGLGLGFGVAWEER